MDVSIPPEAGLAETGRVGSNAAAWSLTLASLALMGGIAYWAWTFQPAGIGLTWFALLLALFGFTPSTGVLPWSSLAAVGGVAAGNSNLSGMDAVLTYGAFAVVWTLLLTTIHLAAAFRRRPVFDLGVIGVRFGSVLSAALVGVVLVGSIVMFITEGLPSGEQATEMIPAALVGLGAALLAATLVLSRRFANRPPPIAAPSGPAPASGPAPPVPGSGVGGMRPPITDPQWPASI